VLVATAAAVVLAGVCFMPSASAAGTSTAASATPAASASAVPTTPAAAPTPTPAAGAASAHAAGDLADTGAVDTTPYLVGGSAFLLVGAALVTEATRRGRRAAHAEAGPDLAL
jgi:hypothetical protein